MEQEIINLQLRNKSVLLRLIPFDTDIDIDDLLQIHYHNLYGELLTCQVLMNRVGNIKAEMEEIIALSKLEVEVYYATMCEQFRKSLTRIDKSVTKKGDVEKTTYKAPTKDEVENSVLIDKGYQIKKQNHFRRQKDLSYIESLYWSVKEKCDNIKRLSEKVKPEEFEKLILEESINGVQIKLKKALIPN